MCTYLIQSKLWRQNHALYAPNYDMQDSGKMLNIKQTESKYASWNNWESYQSQKKRQENNYYTSKNQKELHTFWKTNKLSNWLATILLQSFVRSFSVNSAQIKQNYTLHRNIILN